MEGLVITQKETNRARRTHFLETAEGGICHDRKRNQPREPHSRSGDSRGRNLSGDVKKPTERGALTSWRRRMEGLVRTRKEIDRARHTHFLEAAEGGICQDMERNRPTEAYSPTEGSRGRDLSGHRRKSTERGSLTSWRRQ